MKKKLVGLFVALFAAFLIIATGPQTVGAKDRANDNIAWQYTTPKAMKKILLNKDKQSYQVVDIQPTADYKKGHLPNSLSLHAYPVDTKQLENLVTKSAAKIKKGANPIYVVCPGGGSGAKRTVSILIDKGVKAKRLHIVQNGAKGWPYKDNSKLWVTN
ncbi:MAG: rhodanese-like domain-containing protein [Lactobacillus sp.]|jgi:rhodanese-related sulfurtransferase|nr:rhodanese-like domain-containing protein [Lactobacillus sp.]